MPDLHPYFTNLLRPKACVEHEFLAFNKLSERDVTGITLNSFMGMCQPYFAREDPYLDEDDKALLESATGSPLRCIEFIFKSWRESSARSSEENPSANLNKTVIVIRSIRLPMRSKK